MWYASSHFDVARMMAGSWISTELASVMYVADLVDGKGSLQYGLTFEDACRILDRSVSVSAMVEVEDDFDYVENHNELYVGDPSCI